MHHDMTLHLSEKLGRNLYLRLQKLHCSQQYIPYLIRNTCRSGGLHGLKYSMVTCGTEVIICFIL